MRREQTQRLFFALKQPAHPLAEQRAVVDDDSCDRPELNDDIESGGYFLALAEPVTDEHQVPSRRHRQILGERFFGNHHSGGVNTHGPLETFQAASNIHDFLDIRIRFTQ